MISLTLASSLGTKTSLCSLASWSSPTSSFSLKGHKKSTLCASHHSRGDKIPFFEYLWARSLQNPLSVMRTQPRVLVPLRRPGKPQVAWSAGTLWCISTWWEGRGERDLELHAILCWFMHTTTKTCLKCVYFYLEMFPLGKFVS